MPLSNQGSTLSDFDLTTRDGLARACAELLDRPETFAEELEWYPAFEQLVADAWSADRETRASRNFHEKLWLTDPDRVSRNAFEFNDAALDDADFREWFADWTFQPTPSGLGDRKRYFADFLREASLRLRKHFKSMPRVRLRLGIAPFHPNALTSTVLLRPLGQLLDVLGVESPKKPLMRSIVAANRIESVLGPCAPTASARAQRLALSSLLLKLHGGGTATTTEEQESEQPGQLVPLPASRRRKGLTAIKGKFEGLLTVIEFVSNGVTRDELLDFLRSEAPSLKESTLGIWINCLRAEFDVIRRDGDQYVLTDRGEALLETQDPIELASFLLTQILGVDETVVRLRDDGPMSRGDLVEALQRMNPGWTSDYAPTSMINWLRSFGAIELRDDHRLHLTDAGQRWAELVTWQPEPFVPKDVDEEEIEHEPTVAADTTLVVPPLTSITTRLAAHGTFPPTLVAQLHAGLWANARRHFAVLSGLSGSGKTLLARGYAKSLFDDETRAGTHLRVVAVQPGWYDPTALLGYVNPLRGDAYVRTEFLEFLMRVVEHPSEPFVCVLDEMNLSHPEQYMAPLLSAMETGSSIHLHSEGAVFDGVPPRIPYPKNLVLIGTVNMDETTHGLSDKVLDRAFTLEFWNIDLDAYPRWTGRELEKESTAAARVLLEGLMKALAPARMHFGWRVVDEVLDFLVRNQAEGSPLERTHALDAVVYAKILPKLRGEDAPRFRTALEQAETVLKEHGLPESRAKLAQLTEDLDHRGSARFWR